MEKKTSFAVSLQTLTITESFTNACQGTWCVIMSENSSGSLCWVFGHSGCELFPIPWQAYWGRPQLTLSCLLWLCNKYHHRDVTRHSDQYNVSKGVEAVILLDHMLASLPAEEKTQFNSGVIINASKSICLLLRCWSYKRSLGCRESGWCGNFKVNGHLIITWSRKTFQRT